MIKVNIHEAKTHLSRYLEKMAKGETIVICKRNVPIAEIRPIVQGRRSQRPIGMAKDKFRIPPEFFEPFPPEIVDSFYGKGQ